MWIASIVSLLIVAVLCFGGVFHRAYRDNTLQCIGMGLLFIASVSRIYSIWETRAVDPSWTFFHFSVAVYSVGTAFKVMMMHGRQAGWQWLAEFDYWVARRSRATSDHSRWGAQ